MQLGLGLSLTRSGGGVAITAVPVNTVAPTVSGFGDIDSTITIGNGSWSNSPNSYTYQATRGGVDIVGGTTKTYVIVGADTASEIGGDVIASNVIGAALSAASSSNTILATAFTALLLEDAENLLIEDGTTLLEE